MNEPKKVHPLADCELINRIWKYNDGDALLIVMNRYQPLIKSIAARCYVRDMDFEDWGQEAALVLIKISRHYDQSRNSNFGAYYKRCLQNHFYDLIRRQGAKKRVPNGYLMSYSVNQTYYDDLFMDAKATRPEQSILVTEDLQKLLKRCSYFERRVIIGLVVNRRSVLTIAKQNHCSVSKVKNASERYCRKFNRMRNNGLN